MDINNGIIFKLNHKTMPFAIAWVSPEDSIPSKMSQTENISPCLYLDSKNKLRYTEM